MTIATAKEQPPQRPLAAGQPLDPTALAVPSHPLEQNTQVCPPGWDGMPGCGVQAPYSGTTLPPGTTLWRGKLLGPPEVHIPGLTGSVLSRATAISQYLLCARPTLGPALGYASRPCHLPAVTPQASLPVPGPPSGLVRGFWVGLCTVRRAPAPPLPEAGWNRAWSTPRSLRANYILTLLPVRETEAGRHKGSPSGSGVVQEMTPLGCLLSWEPGSGRRPQDPMALLVFTLIISGSASVSPVNRFLVF